MAPTMPDAITKCLSCNMRGVKRHCDEAGCHYYICSNHHVSFVVKRKFRYEVVKCWEMKTE